MRRALLMGAALLLGCNASLAQVSTMGTTAMGIPTTPGAIVTSPLNGPGPFSATTLPGAPVTTLAPLPLALDPTAPGTSINCSPISAQTTSSFPTQTTSSAPTGGATASSAFTAPPGTIVPLGTALPPGTIVILPQGTLEPPGTIVLTPGTVVALGTSVASTASTSTTAPIPLGPSATTSTSISGSTTGTIAPITPLGSSTVTGTCNLSQGSPSVNGAALPLTTPQIPNSPPPGTIQPVITEFGGTSIDPTMTGTSTDPTMSGTSLDPTMTVTVIPTPNSAACGESVSMTLANPGMMAPANVTGATATPGVSPAGC